MKAALRADAGVHRPRPRRREERQRPRRGDVPRQALRGGASPTTSTPSPAHPYTAALLTSIPVPDPTVRPSEGDDARRRAALAAGPAERLPVPHPLPEGAGHVRAGRAQDAPGRARATTWPATSRSTSGENAAEAPDSTAGCGLTEPASRPRPPKGGSSCSGTQRPRTRLDPEVRREQIVEAAERVFAGSRPRRGHLRGDRRGGRRVAGARLQLLRRQGRPASPRSTCAASTVWSTSSTGRCAPTPAPPDPSGCAAVVAVLPAVRRREPELRGG